MSSQGKKKYYMIFLSLEKSVVVFIMSSFIVFFLVASFHLAFYLIYHTIKMLTNKRQLKGYYSFQKFLSSLCMDIWSVHFLNSSVSQYFYLLLLGTHFLSSLKKQNSTIIYVPYFSPALVLATVCLFFFLLLTFYFMLEYSQLTML